MSCAIKWGTVLKVYPEMFITKNIWCHGWSNRKIVLRRTWGNHSKQSCMRGTPQVSSSLQPEDVWVPVLLPHELLDALARAGSQQAWVLGLGGLKHHGGSWLKISDQKLKWFLLQHVSEIVPESSRTLCLATAVKQLLESFGTIAKNAQTGKITQRYLTKTFPNRVDFSAPSGNSLDGVKVQPITACCLPERAQDWYHYLSTATVLSSIETRNSMCGVFHPFSVRVMSLGTKANKGFFATVSSQ